MTKKTIDGRLDDIEKNNKPKVKMLVAHQDPPGSDTYKMDGRIYTGAELDELDGDDIILLRVVYYSPPLPLDYLGGHDD